MKTSGDAPAIPTSLEQVYSGLTKREYFAAMALTGLVVPAIAGSHNNFSKGTGFAENIALYAVNLADALIAELNEESV